MAKSLFNLPADSLYYFYGKKKIFLQYSQSNIAVQGKRKEAAFIMPTTLLGDIKPEKSQVVRDDLLLLKFTDFHNLENIKKSIRSDPSYAMLPVFEADGSLHIVTDEIIVGYNSSSTGIERNNILRKYRLAPGATKALTDEWQVVKCDTSQNDLLTISRFIRKEKSVSFCEPNFIRIMPIYTNDPYYNNQWHLENSGKRGKADADIDAPDAWTLSEGDPDIVIAILDLGVQTTHPDLMDNLVPGYDAYDEDNNPNPDSYESHGTACAGLAAAVTNNNLGIAGVAPRCRIMPLRIGKTERDSPEIISTNAKMANAIEWAWQNGASVLSNSWGGGTPSSTVNNAIDHARTSGRQGLGCVVLFASGNNNSAVSWPAVQANVIAVGATNEYDERCNTSDWGEGSGSNFGNELDVVAPGIELFTTDNTGGGGYTSGDYVDSFGGTSGACPIAAGVAGLILSMNPALTADEAQSVLQNTADDLVGRANEDVPGFDIYHGHGRVNAHRALSSLSTPFIRVTSPNGGEEWPEGTSHEITWESMGTCGFVGIDYRINGDSDWIGIVDHIKDNNSYFWLIPELPADYDNCYIRVYDVNQNLSDTNDQPFKLVDHAQTGLFNVLVPNGYEVWAPGSSKKISWNSIGSGTLVDIAFSMDGGQSFDTIVNDFPNNGCYMWNIPKVVSRQVRIKVLDSENPSNLDVSDHDFSIANQLSGSFLKANDIFGSAGNIVTLFIDLSSMSRDIYSFGFSLKFNPSQLEFVQIETGSMVSSWPGIAATLKSTDTVVIRAYNPVPLLQPAAGVLLKILFKVICIDCNDCSQSAIELTDLIEDLQGLIAFNGAFIYGDRCKLGDVNMDAAITPADAYCAFRFYLNKGILDSGAECNTLCAKDASDANCDGQVTPLDALIIFNAYLAHLTSIECPSITRNP